MGTRNALILLLLIAGCIPSARKGNSEVLRRRGFLVLEENGKEWITDCEWETNTQLEAMNKAHGIVWTYGLGLGLFAETVAAKPNVEKIVVVEINKDIIDLVWKHLDLKGKGEIVHADALEWVETAKGPVDFIYADIWRGDEPDYEETCGKFQEQAKRLGAEIICWNE